MMKTFRLLFIFTAALIFAVSCTEDNQMDADLAAKKATFLSNERWSELDLCNVQTHDLIGGQDILMGSVIVGNTADSLYVKYQASEGYVITETHLFVGDVMGEDFPKTKKDNPKIGHFPYSTEDFGSVSIVMYSIGLDELDPELGDCFDVAAHAVVECADGTCEETAWGAGRQNELVLAAKIFLYEGGYAISDGINISESCVLYDNFGYSVINLNDALAGTATLNTNNGEFAGVLSATVVDGALEFVFESDSFTAILSQSHIFVGTLDDLLNAVDGLYSCPDYKVFPYNLESSISTSDLPNVGSGEIKKLSGKRWGYYLDYCIGSCD